MDKSLEFLVFKRPVQVKEICEHLKEIHCRACYLIINWKIRELVDTGRIQIGLDAYDLLAKHLQAYVYEDTMPPKAIAHVVLNIADDFVRGEPIRLRSGDYIALMNFSRAQKTPTS